MKKIANIIIVHKNPKQVLRLVKQFPEPLYHNFIHVDGRCSLDDYKELNTLSNCTLLPKRRKLVWAGNGFLLVTLDAIRHILAQVTNTHFIYFNVMSGMDFPIKPTTDLYNHLVSAYDTSACEFFEIVDMKTWGAQHRYQLYHLPDLTIRGRYFTERWISKFLGIREFYYGRMIPYGRSAWFTATDRFILFALNYLKEHPSYLRYIKTTWSSDELFWNSLIMNSTFKENLAGSYLRYIDWSAGEVSPKIFRSNDLDMILKSGQFLARKFDEQIDSDILDLLEQNNISKSYLSNSI